MKNPALFLAMIATITVSASSSYRILGIFPENCKSHNIVYESLMKGLVNHGHQVDVISHYLPKKPLENYNVIINLAGRQKQSTSNWTVSEALLTHSECVQLIADNFGNTVCEFLGLDEVQKLIQNPPTDPPYDVVITEAFGANCFMGFGHVLKVPVVAVSTNLDFPWVNHFIGNDDNLAYVPHAFYHIGSSRMSFYERLMNVIVSHYLKFKFHQVTYEKQTELMRRYLDPNIPDIRQVEKNIALTLVNTHPILSGVKPITPSLIQIAGVHIEMNDENLDLDLKRWMDESVDGVVYFSLGSRVLFESLPKEQLLQIYSSFAKISPVRVLVKISDSTKLPADLPANVKPMSWIPQQPTLAHPNMKVFITHGGLGGIQEALHYGIPMIGIPLQSDQFRNVDTFVKKQMMIRINWDEISEKTLDSALKALLHEPIYKEKAMYYSKVFRDRPISPMKNAIFWIEYVIRNGADVLKSPALQLSFVQLELLDVYGVLLLLYSLVVFIVFLLVKFLLRKLKTRFIIFNKIKSH